MHRSFWHTGLTVGPVFTVCTKLCAQPMSGAAETQEAGAEFGVITGAGEAVGGGGIVLLLIQMFKAAVRSPPHKEHG